MPKEKIQGILDSIKTNIITTNELDKSLYRKMDYESFKLTYIQRSKILRDIFKRNQKLIEELHEILKEDLTKEVANSLYEGYRQLEKEEIHDSFLLLQIIDKLIPFYEKENDYSKLLNLYNDENFELSIFLMINQEKIDKIKDNIQKTMALKNHYEELGLNERKIIYYSYYNFMSYLPNYDESYIDKMISIYKEAKAFYHSEAVFKMNDQDLARREMNLLNEALLHNFMYYLDDGLCDQMEFVRIIDEIKDTFEDEMDRDLCYAVLTYLNDQMDDLEFIYYLENYHDFFYQDVLKLSFNESKDEIYVRSAKLVDAECILFDFLKHSYLPDNTKEEVAKRIITKALKYFDRVPKDRYTRLYVEEATSRIVKKALPFSSNADLKERLFTSLILRRQELNYVHSQIVEKIAVAILDSMNETRYPLIKDMIEIGFWDFADLKGYVSRSARLHDIGKSLALGIVNQQIRSLLPDEYHNIILHPEGFQSIIEKDKDFKYYVDVIKGHHKSYDGKSGYPKDFDNTKSKYKLIIDLITIADCIDAGTDNYGRNYHDGKNFDMVFKELKDGANTLYNPDIVSYIEQNGNLMNELKYIVDDYRMELRYEIYVK